MPRLYILKQFDKTVPLSRRIPFSADHADAYRGCIVAKTMRPDLVLCSAGLNLTVPANDVLISDGDKLWIEVLSPCPQSFESPLMVPLVDIKNVVVSAVR